MNDLTTGQLTVHEISGLDSEQCFEIRNNSKTIASVPIPYGNYQRGLRIARLLAAAPDLLNASRTALKAIQYLEGGARQYRPDEFEAVVALGKAIAEAEGR